MALLVALAKPGPSARRSLRETRHQKMVKDNVQARFDVEQLAQAV
jgi:hypothetical protein